MEVDMEADNESHSAPRFIRPNNSGMNAFLSDCSESTSRTSHSMPYSTQTLNRRLAPNSIGLQMTPTKMLLNQTRRSSSGIFITSMFGSRFRHLQKLHSEAFLGLNSICLPGLPMGAVFRSSLPATPVATPIHREAFQHFSEQAIRERLCRTPSPRKNRGFLSGSQQTEQTTDQQMRSDSSCSQSGPQDSGLSDIQPMDITSPIIDETVIEDTKEEESANGGGNGQHFFNHSDRLERNSSDLFERRVFVGNISYRVKESELSDFMRKFGKVYNCCIVMDHIRKRPKGYGFITFQKANDCQSLLNADPNELILDNRQLRVFRSEPKTTKQMKKQIQEISEERKLIIEYRNNQNSNHSLNYEKRTNIVGFNDLNDYVILQIFANFDDLIQKTIIEFVCKRWRDLMIQLWSSQTHISFASTFLNFGGPALETSTLFSILKKCSNLRSIDLKNVTTFLDIKALEIIAVSCPHLEDLAFDSGIATNYSIKVLGEKCPKLKSLYLNDCTNVNEDGFWWLFKSASNLEILEIKNNQKLNGNCFRLLSETLKSLDITNCVKIRDKGISELVAKNRSSLTCLSLSSINFNIMKMICSNLKNLTLLRISHLTQINEFNDVLNGFSLISELENLEILENRTQFEDIDDQSMTLIIKKCQKLKELVLTLNYRITDNSMALIPQYLPHLQKLCANNSKITDESLNKWSALNNLKYVDINNSQLITDIGVQSLALSAKCLSFLQLNDCENISLNCIKCLIETISSDALYPELIICFDKIRINTKKQNIAQIQDIIIEREKILFADSEESDLDDI